MRIPAEAIPEDFRRLVARELLEADRRAGQLAGEAATDGLRGYRLRKGLCVGCGNGRDERTPGCRACTVRHSMRRTLQKRRGDRPPRWAWGRGTSESSRYRHRAKAAGS